MGISRSISLGLAASALTFTSVSPAMAGWGVGVGQHWGGGFSTAASWGGGYGYRGHRRHRDRDNDTGEILGGMVLGALLLGAISSANKKKRAARDRDYEGYPQRDQRTQNDGRTNDGRDDQRSRSEIASEDQAVDACAYAAEGKGGRSASVRDINKVDRSSDGWDVEGVIEMRDNWRDRQPERHRFTCSVRFGAVDSVYIENDKVALAD